MTQTRNSSSSDDCCPELRELLPPAIFKALGDVNRVALLCELAERRQPCTVSEASECCPVDMSVVSRHLATLREAGIVEAEKRGRKVYYTVRCAELASSLRAIADALESCCPPSPEEQATA